jgi:hypothetical protein
LGRSGQSEAYADNKGAYDTVPGSSFQGGSFVTQMLGETFSFNCREKKRFRCNLKLGLSLAKG